MGKATPETVIADYIAAYETENGKPAPKMTYQRGWFVTFNPYTQRYRRKQIENMTATLRYRTRARGKAS